VEPGTSQTTGTHAHHRNIHQTDLLDFEINHPIEAKIEAWEDQWDEDDEHEQHEPYIYFIWGLEQELFFNKGRLHYSKNFKHYNQPLHN
jgi:hypothetical protein